MLSAKDGKISICIIDTLNSLKYCYEVEEEKADDFVKKFKKAHSWVKITRTEKYGAIMLVLERRK